MTGVRLGGPVSFVETLRSFVVTAFAALRKWAQRLGDAVELAVGEPRVERQR